VVREALAILGVERDRMSARGFGESRPVAPNTKPDGSDNPAGRAQNRRVEILLAGAKV
jgi:outer membrane protein OmpA-like peptidoglycan-associated protein